MHHSVDASEDELASDAVHGGLYGKEGPHEVDGIVQQRDQGHVLNARRRGRMIGESHVAIGTGMLGGRLRRV